MTQTAITWLCPSCEAEESHKCRICDGLGFLTEGEYAHYLKLESILNVSTPVLELDLSEFDK